MPTTFILQAKDIAKSIRRVFLSCNKEALIPWDDLTTAIQDGWCCAASAGLHLAQEADGLPWITLGTRMRDAYHTGAALPVSRDLNFLVGLSWEACARHLANLMDPGDEPDLAGMEAYWPGWVHDKLAKIKEDVVLAPDGKMVTLTEDVP